MNEIIDVLHFTCQWFLMLWLISVENQVKEAEADSRDADAEIPCL